MAIADDLSNQYQKNKDFQSFILQIILSFNLGDENTVLFLDKCLSFKDIIDFVYNVQSLEEKASSFSLKGLKLTTIHKSKGLEFENVILLDQLGRDQIDNSRLLFEYKNTDLKNIYLKIRNRDIFDTNYKNALAEEEKNKKNDLINSLYVAFTRAKNNLFVLKANQKSKFDILSLKEKEQGSLEIKSVSTTTPKQSIYNQCIDIIYYGTQDDFLKKEKKSNTDLEDILNIHYGNAIHFLFESLHKLDVASIDLAYKVTKNKFGFYLSDEILLNIKKIVKDCILDETFQQLISNKTIKKEVSFCFDKQIGVIDLLLEDENIIYVVDYKSSPISKQQIYIPQINFYKQALKTIYNKSNQGIFVFCP